MEQNTSRNSCHCSQDLDPQVLDAILAAIKSIRYGSVEIFIQDSKIIQIERKDKVRFDKLYSSRKGTQE